MDQVLWQKEFTASGPSFCSIIIALYLLSESTKAMGVREHYVANKDRKATWINTKQNKTTTIRASHSRRTTPQLFVNVSSPVASNTILLKVQNKTE